MISTMVLSDYDIELYHVDQDGAPVREPWLITFGFLAHNVDEDMLVSAQSAQYEVGKGTFLIPYAEGIYPGMILVSDHTFNRGRSTYDIVGVSPNHRISLRSLSVVRRV